MSNFIDSGERVDGADGLRIFFRSLRPAEKPRAFAVIVPGFNAHSGYYARAAELRKLRMLPIRMSGT